MVTSTFLDGFPELFNVTIRENVTLFLWRLVILFFVSLGMALSTCRDTPAPPSARFR